MADSGRNTSRKKTGTQGKTSYQKSTGSSGRSRSSSSTGRSSSGKAKSNAKKKQANESEFQLQDELIVIGMIALVIFLFLCTIKVISSKDPEHLNLGDYVRLFMTGVFGITSYVVPILTFLGVAFGISNKENPKVYVKIGAGIILVAVFGIIAHLISYPDIMEISKMKGWGKEFYAGHKGGGFVFGAVTVLFCSLIGKVGTIFLSVVLSIVAFVMLTGKSFIRLIQSAGESLAREEEDEEEEEERPVRRSSRKDIVKESVKEVPEKRMDRKSRGVTFDTFLKPRAEKKEETGGAAPAAEPEKIHTIAEDTIKEEKIPVNPVMDTGNDIKDESEKIEEIKKEEIKKEESKDIHRVIADFDTFPANDEEDSWLKPVNQLPPEPKPVNEEKSVMFESTVLDDKQPDGMEEITFPEENAVTKPVARLRSTDKPAVDFTQAKGPSVPKKLKKEYRFPPLTLLQKPSGNGVSDDASLMAETARRLEETLETFGVKVKVTDYSKGPAVTRYELHPEQGVKVAKITSLADDIKLNLAAADIRIEAPIPGKTAVGIEVPNQKSTAVPLRELLEGKEFKASESRLSFAVGKDISGQHVVADIAKMPHVLIAGATGSGKSVCINTLIMSILYKADPDDVKLIMIDPKVVELSVYNGIPHLMLPVVTDPKKASASLQWGVKEMENRYKKFADAGCRDLKGYNQKAEELKDTPEGELHKKLPQIVIIVDELADLMMVASKEVEESICRLAQLARAAGIHLVIATQRPSVDVITGLIKANMPSRIAFSVSSGVDSRTILDSNGAEKLLGKGDMLFFPQGYTKPARVQGAFVTDSEVASVVDFIKNQGIENNSDVNVEESISSAASGGAGNGDSDYDELFAEAGRFVIEKEKGSIGMLQRVFKIGFNRAARIMDQLEEAGVVGPEEGTKPRRILMTKEEFENTLGN